MSVETVAVSIDKDQEGYGPGAPGRVAASAILKSAPGKGLKGSGLPASKGPETLASAYSV